LFWSPHVQQRPGLGGVYAGYNWQVTNRVWGIEDNFAWGNDSATNAGILGVESPTVAGVPGLDTGGAGGSKGG